MAEGGAQLAQTPTTFQAYDWVTRREKATRPLLLFRQHSKSEWLALPRMGCDFEIVHEADVIKMFPDVAVNKSSTTHGMCMRATRKLQAPALLLEEPALCRNDPTSARNLSPNQREVFNELFNSSPEKGNEGVLSTNAFDGAGICVAMSRCNHSCAPTQSSYSMRSAKWSNCFSFTMWMRARRLQFRTVLNFFCTMNAKGICL